MSEEPYVQPFVSPAVNVVCVREKLALVYNWTRFERRSCVHVPRDKELRLETGTLLSKIKVEKE
jgi:hypothetical protein